MPSFTRNYNLGYFDLGDSLSTDFSAEIEISRWSIVDSTLFGLMSLWGNGVASGWEVSATGSFEITISKGFGNINSIAARTSFPYVIPNLSPNTTNYVYVRNRPRTTFTEEVEFVLDQSSTLSESNANFLLLSRVTTGSNSVELIDNSIRNELDFIEIIKAAIKLHRHRGGSINPSKIDLASEVKGQLPSYRIADFDAEKISTGTFDLSRIPLLDHSLLTNVGILTHPQLDSFVKTLETGNKELFGELSLANLLQLIIATKLIYEDSTSNVYSQLKIDENMTNEFVIIPGISPNSYIDFDNSTAIINTTNHFVKGITPVTGTSFYVTYDTRLAWESAYFSENTTIVDDTVTLAFNQEQESTTKVVENFETATTPSQQLNDGSLKLFTKQVVVIVDNAQILSDSNSTNVSDGFYSGKFQHRQAFRSQYVKEFTSVQDWSTYDTFILDIKCLSLVHGSVKMYFTDSSGEKTSDYFLLDQDEITDGFESRFIDLSEIAFRNKIKSIVIFTDDLTNNFSYFIDNVRIQRALLLPEEGTLRLRYSTSSSVVFSVIEWSSDEPSGTEIQVRAKSANGTVFLNRAAYTTSLNSGDNIHLAGTDLEIEVTFLSDSQRLLAPILNSLRILILSEADIDGFAIDSESEFSRGTTKNVQIETSSIVLDSPVYVDSIYFALNNGVHQSLPSVTSSGVEFINSNNEPTLFGRKNTPIAPNLVFRSVEEQGNFARVAEASFFEPRSVKRQIDRSFVIADTYNDRVLQLDEDGELIAGLGSINYQASSLFPIASCVDIRTGILYVVWSKKISFRTVNVSKIVIQSSDRKVQLIRDFDKISGKSTSELLSTNIESQIMPVVLSPQNASIIENFPATVSYLQMDSSSTSGVISGGFNIDSVFYRAVVTGLGIPCFIGNFAYVDGIFSPTSADKSTSDGFIIGNATVAVKDYIFSGISETISKNTNVSSIVEYDENNNAIFGSNVMQFSPFIPGRVEEIDVNNILIGGIKPGGIAGVLGQGDALNFRSVFGENNIKNVQKRVLKQYFFGNTNSSYVGSVVLYDRRVNSTVFQYTSPEGLLVSDVDVDSSGRYVVAESGLDKSGRIVKLDAIGNVVFSLGEGQYNLINRVNVQNDGSLLIST